MKIVLQRVSRAMVDVRDETVGEIADGLVLLLAIGVGDDEKKADKMIEKILKLKIFSDGVDSDSFMQKSVVDVGGAVLVVSQFTLYGDTDKGTKPSFTQSSPPDQARELYEYFVKKMREIGVRTETGEFGEHMELNLVNDGPVTLILEN